MIMGSRARASNIILKRFGIESEKYNLGLHKDNYVYVGMNGAANTQFKNGTKIRNTDNIMYLGSTITGNASRNTGQNVKSPRHLSQTSNLSEKKQGRYCLESPSLHCNHHSTTYLRLKHT